MLLQISSALKGQKCGKFQLKIEMDGFQEESQMPDMVLYNGYSHKELKSL